MDKVATDCNSIATDELVPPPGAGLVTATETEVPEARSDAGTDAVNWEEETKLVVVGPPLSRICEVETKLLPSTVIVVVGDPTARVAGERFEIAGTGLLTVKFTEFDRPPPGDGFVTTTANAPAAAWSLALS